MCVIVETRFPVDLRLLVKQLIANIGILLDIFGVLPVWWLFVSFQTSLLCIIRELAEGHFFACFCLFLSVVFLYLGYYPHTSRDLVSPVFGIFSNYFLGEPWTAIIATFTDWLVERGHLAVYQWISCKCMMAVTSAAGLFAINLASPFYSILRLNMVKSLDYLFSREIVLPLINFVFPSVSPYLIIRQSTNKWVWGKGEDQQSDNEWLVGLLGEIGHLIVCCPAAKPCGISLVSWGSPPLKTQEI